MSGDNLFCELLVKLEDIVRQEGGVPPFKCQLSLEGLNK